MGRKKEVDNLTEQMRFWKGNFGKEYLKRNPKSVKELNKRYTGIYGVTRTSMNKEFLREISKDARILEVGSGSGIQLKTLQEMGYKDLMGIDISQEAIEDSKKLTQRINIIKALAQNIPFKNNYFDLVFTSGLLIHLQKEDLKITMKEMYRVSKKFLWGFEYFSENRQEINYRGNKNKLWKDDFALIYRQKFKNLELLKQKKFHYLNDINVDSMFLLKKPKPKGVEK